MGLSPETGTPLELMEDLAGRLDRGEIIGKTQYASRCAAALRSVVQDTVTRAEATAAQAQRIAELEAGLKSVADDLEAELRERYRDMLDHPAMARRFDRDMASVNDARALLQPQQKDGRDD